MEAAAPPAPTTTPTPAKRIGDIIANLEGAYEDSKGLCSVNRQGLIGLLREVETGISEGLDIRVYKAEAITHWRNLEQLLDALEEAGRIDATSARETLIRLVEEIRAQPMRDLGISREHAALIDAVEAARGHLRAGEIIKALEDLDVGLAAGGR